MLRPLTFLITLVVRAIRALSHSRQDLVLENLALRQQVTLLKEMRPRPRLDDVDRGFWVALRASWAGWASRLVIVKPDTVVRWHHDRFRRHWARISREGPGPGRPRVDTEVRELVLRMATENGWGAPRIHGEIKKLGIEVSETTVGRYMPRKPADPEQIQRWITFLRNHKDVIAAMDFFTVPTPWLVPLYGFFVIEHGRRRILHFNATFNPSASWVIQQLREAFPYDSAPSYLIFDRDAIFSPRVVAFIKGMGTKPCRISYRSPWQNPVAERWVGSAKREILDHVIVFGERHLVRLVTDYISHYHEDRCHLGLAKDTPSGRLVSPRRSTKAEVVALPRLGGLSHRYEWREAA
jgi:transposase InsO family protein